MNNNGYFHPGMGGYQQQQQSFNPYQQQHQQLLEQHQRQVQQQQQQLQRAVAANAARSPAEQPTQVAAATCRDVLNGRGQGVQRHSGNVKYRTLVFVNKGLYAKCPRSDKMKISKGIVAAVRELGGRFLENDERTGAYKDIGDKKATEKTSQALREGQTKIRKQMFKDEESSGNNPTYDTTLLTATATPSPEGSKREISAEGYFGYSVQVLESLYVADEKAAAAQAEEDISPPSAESPQPLPAAVAPASAAAPAANAAARSNAAALAMVMDQFPGAVMAPPAAQPAPQEKKPPPLPQAQQEPPPLPQQPPVDTSTASAVAAMESRSSVGRYTNTPDESRSSIGRYTNTSNGSGPRLNESSNRQSLGRLTNMSLNSVFSIHSVHHLLDSARHSDMSNIRNGRASHLENNGERSSIESVLSNEIRDLIRQSQFQLMQVENMTMDEMNGIRFSNSNHENREVNLFNEEQMKDRVSDLRFTDVSRDNNNHARFTTERNTRWTDSSSHRSTDSTTHSNTSLMDASMMTIPTEDMSVHCRTSVSAPAGFGVGQMYREEDDDDQGDLASAELLLRLSTDNNYANHAAV